MPDSQWSEGYVTDTAYTEKLHRELSPGWLNYVAILNGHLPIRLNEPFRYLELGCGVAESRRYRRPA